MKLIKNLYHELPSLDGVPNDFFNKLVTQIVIWFFIASTCGSIYWAIKLLILVKGGTK